MKERFDPAPILSRLKDFQRRTVEYVFRRMYLDDEPTRRFLVADEVGLGKTLVARGLIAKTLEHLHDKVDRIDIVYICSNAAIAKQNINRLNVSDKKEFSLATRLTLLPAQVADLSENPVNFVSFTPGTTFEMKSSGGQKRERAIIYRILKDEEWLDRKGLYKVLQCGAGNKGWKWSAITKEVTIDPSLAAAFRTEVAAHPQLRKRLTDLAEIFRSFRRHTPDDANHQRFELVGELRQLMATTCLDALEPDLVILDEFQRFRDLLTGDSPAATLARDLFNYQDVRVLMLSATPYKMLTLDHENEEDHYPEFLKTLEFLFDDPGVVKDVREEIQEFRQSLYVTGADSEIHLKEVQRKLERRLLSVMTRTERIAMTHKRNAMLTEPLCPTTLKSTDLLQAALIDHTAQAVGSQDVIEYWKSAPYLLSYLKHYDLRRKLDNLSDQPPEELLSEIQNANGQLLTRSNFEEYQTIDAGNPRMRRLFQDTIDRGLWKVLWLPPSMPYSQPDGPFTGIGDVTKRLVFSCWNAVPDAIASLCSYEAERRMTAGLGREFAHSTLYDQLKPLLRFSHGREQRLTGMPTLALMYPSPSLADLVDPLKLSLTSGSGRSISQVELISAAEEVLAGPLTQIRETVCEEEGGVEDQRWYWAAPVLLDAERFPEIRDWLAFPSGWRKDGSQGDDDGSSGFDDHLDELVRALDGKLDHPLGRPPSDLVRVLAQLALAGPSVCALRSLLRVAPEADKNSAASLFAAARIANGFRTLFNIPESIALLRAAHEEEPYWRLVLQHGLDGNLQSLLDEQAHVLVEALGVFGIEYSKRMEQISTAISDALSVRTAPLNVDEISVNEDERSLKIASFRTRCRFALRFGDLKDDQDQSLARADHVRHAFNSPFRPFVLASTSIGQEGLDFHVWCHAIVHWNLPSNPVDLEQREGRVHRYKGHAIRKNIARHYGLRELSERWCGNGDPWDHLFQRAAEDRPEGTSELVPYWLFETEEGASIERYVPLLPFSKEIEQLKRLKKSLALYRLVFGQPRQQDLLTHLTGRMSEEEAQEAVHKWQISLLPPEPN